MKHYFHKMLLAAVLLVVAQAVSAQAFRGNIERGYRAFAGAGVENESFESDDARTAVLMETSHGYQFSKVIFLGGGVGVHHVFAHGSNNAFTAVPYFLHFRCDFPIASSGPFLETKVGGVTAGSTGLYLAQHVGCRWRLNDKMGLSVSAGITLLGLKEGCDDVEAPHSSDNDTFNGLSFKAAIDF